MTSTKLAKIAAMSNVNFHLTSAYAAICDPCKLISIVLYRERPILSSSPVVMTAVATYSDDRREEREEWGAAGVVIGVGK